jgi:hypothetical protein
MRYVGPIVVFLTAAVLAQAPAGGADVNVADSFYGSRPIGDVFVIQAGRQYVVLAKNPMNEVIMASPAIADGLLIIRTLGHVWGIAQ